MCGGTPAGVWTDTDAEGLSPRVRGNRLTDPYAGNADRSIPACAGEPCQLPMPPNRCQVYPRVCGGTTIERSPRIRRIGLSPRVRGNRLLSGYCWHWMRSIPACAGEPASASHGDVNMGVYPRVCGGTIEDKLDSVETKGLSPRVRGNLRMDRGPTQQCRSIPACAGEPTAGLSGGFIHEVYPRVCGGTLRITLRKTRICGLSPRVRGNPTLIPEPKPVTGSIPACAGEPRPRT